MRKLVKYLVVGLACSILIACGNKSVNSVSTDGSTSMEKVIGSLGEAFEDETGIKVTYNPTGSGAGIQAVQEGRCDIGLSSRHLKDSEKEAGAVESILAYDGIAIIVHPDNPVSDLSMGELKKIYTGEIANWSGLGGNNAEIVLIGREAGSGTRDGFESITDTKDVCKYRQELTSTGDVITAVSQNPDAVGYASVASVKDIVKILSIDGVLPNTGTIQDGSYKVRRPFLLIIDSGKSLSEAAQKYFDYITSEKAKEIIIGVGLVPVD